MVEVVDAIYYKFVVQEGQPITLTLRMRREHESRIDAAYAEACTPKTLLQRVSTRIRSATDVSQEGHGRRDMLSGEMARRRKDDPLKEEPSRAGGRPNPRQA